MDYRSKCLDEKGEQCIECGSTEDIEVHHIDADRWNNSLSNLLPLCHSCHQKVHNGHPDMKHWTSKLESGPPGGKRTDQEIDEAFEEAGLT